MGVTLVSMASRVPVVLKLLMGLGALACIGWSIVGRQVIIVDMEDGEVAYSYRYRLPGLAASFEHNGTVVEIVNEAQYAVLNISDETMVLSRAGGTWPFELYTIEPMVVEVQPGEVVQLPGPIRPATKRGASYFSVLRKRVPDDAGANAVDLLDETVHPQHLELAWPEVYLHKKRLIEWMGEEAVRAVVSEQLGSVSDAPFTDVYIAYDPESQRVFHGFNFDSNARVKSALLTFSLSFEWIETKTSEQEFLGFDDTHLNQQLAAKYPKLLILYRSF